MKHRAAVAPLNIVQAGIMMFWGCLACGESGGIFKVTTRQQQGDVHLLNMHALDLDNPPNYCEVAVAHLNIVPSWDQDALGVSSMYGKWRNIQVGT